MAENGETVANNYKATLSLPQTSFAMRGNLPVLEKTILNTWHKAQMYEKLLAQKTGKSVFYLHDGPPYANGSLHYGHYLNKILKDMVLKDRSMRGYQTPLQPGWDCHGLPIENQVDKNIASKNPAMSRQSRRQLCSAFAEQCIDAQREDFKNIGMWADWEHPYLTKNPDYEAKMLASVATMADHGLLYQALKPVNFCIHHQTALAEAEVEYVEHTSTSLVVGNVLLNPEAFGAPANSMAAIWTTTPWSLPANQAICVHPDERYVWVECAGKVWLWAEKRLGYLDEQSLSYKRLTILPRQGSELIGLRYRHPLQPSSDKPLLLGAHVTMDSGTGLVHTAPGHGLDDYGIGLRHGLPVQCIVKADGRLDDEAGQFAGLNLQRANHEISAYLRSTDQLLHVQPYVHRYPHCWRCLQPIVVRATKQWFMNMDKPFAQGESLRARAIAALDQIDFVPSWGKDRLLGMLTTRIDWCLTRQRVWGVPFPAFYCQQCGKAHCGSRYLEQALPKIAQQGVDYWFENIEQLTDMRCTGCQGALRGEVDIVDVWLESGLSFAAVLPEQTVADMYLEGSDQHRGWFQTSLLCGLALNGKPPFKQLVTHGFVVDGQGKKISKSKHTGFSPQKDTQQHGMELLRLWVASEDFSSDVRYSSTIFAQNKEIYRKLRNTLRFFLGNLHGFEPDRDWQPPVQWDKLEQYILVSFAQTLASVRQAYWQLQFHKGLAELLSFCANSFSAFYFDVRKDCLYADAVNHPKRLGAQSCLFWCAQQLIAAIAPILCFTAEEAYGYLPAFAGKSMSVHLSEYPADSDVAAMMVGINTEAILRCFQAFFSVRKKVYKVVETLRAQKIVGNSTQVHAHIRLPEQIRAEVGQLSEAQWAEYLMVGSVGCEWVDVSDEPVVCSLATGERCPRCWNMRQLQATSGLCLRCVKVCQSQQTSPPTW